MELAPGAGKAEAGLTYAGIRPGQARRAHGALRGARKRASAAQPAHGEARPGEERSSGAVQTQRGSRRFREPPCAAIPTEGYTRARLHLARIARQTGRQPGACTIRARLTIEACCRARLGGKRVVLARPTERANSPLLYGLVCPWWAVHA